MVTPKDKGSANVRVLIRWLSTDLKCTGTAVNQPVRSISAKAQASALSDLIRRLLIASAAWRASMHTIATPCAASSR